jgi:hypothetical protein
MDEGQQIYVSNLVDGKDYIPVQLRRCNVSLTRLETDIEKHIETKQSYM